MSSQFSFFDLDNQLAKIYEISSFLPKLKSLVDFEMFRSDLETIRSTEQKTGRPAFDVVFMFKILVIKSMQNLSDDQTELQIRDRLSFRDFLGLSFADTVPDAKTIWLFGETLKKHELEQKLFDRFYAALAKQGFSAKKGLIVDGSFVEVPRQRNTKTENEQIKKGEIPDTLSSNPHVLSQKDTDAAWAKKGDETFFGYKNHPVVDVENKFICSYGVTDASVHDVNLFTDVVPETSAYENEPYYADAGYVSGEREAELRKRGYEPLVCERVPKKKPLLVAEVKENNRAKSKIRVRVEHVFGEMKMRMGDETLRSIGFSRARFWIGMRNLCYNMSRLVSLVSPKRVKVRG